MRFSKISDFYAMKKAHLKARRIWWEGTLIMTHSYISGIGFVLEVVSECPVDLDGVGGEEGDDFVEFIVFLWGEVELEVWVHDLNNQLLIDLDLNWEYKVINLSPKT